MLETDKNILILIYLNKKLFTPLQGEVKNIFFINGLFLIACLTNMLK